MIKVGEQAPDFTLAAHDGASLCLRDLRGAKVLLWFFVEANTPGCTLEGRGFRDHQSYFDENNIRVVGVSFDSPEDNASFARKHEFGFPLLSDGDHRVAIAYGACAGGRRKVSRPREFPDRRAWYNRAGLRSGRSARSSGARAGRRAWRMTDAATSVESPRRHLRPRRNVDRRRNVQRRVRAGRGQDCRRSPRR